MATDYTDRFGIKSLNGLVTAFGEDVTRTRVFSSKFAMGRPLASRDGTVEWDEIQFSRSLAPVAGRDGPHPLRQGLVKVNRRSAVAYVKEAKLIPASQIHMERGPGQFEADPMGTVAREVQDLTNRIGNTIEYMCARSLDGTLTVNSANIPGTTVPFTITYSPNTYTASASWATAATGIFSAELPALKQDHEQSGGLPAAQVITGATVTGYLAGNTEFTNYAQHLLGPMVLASSANSEGPAFQGQILGGMTWTVTEGGYVPDGGSFTRYIPATDDLYVLPSDADLPNVLGMATGHGLVPLNNNILDVGQAANSMGPAPQPGWYSYATLSTNPLGVVIHVGWVGLPIVLRPAAVCVADVVP